MENLESGLLEVRPGRKLMVYHGGAPAAPLLLLIHGAGGRGEQWHHQVTFFRRDYYLVVPDLLGHGASPVPRRGYSFAELAADLAALFVRFRRQRNIVIGHSYGTAFALWLAGRYGTAIERIVLLGAAPLRPPGKRSIWKLPVFVLRLLRPMLSDNFARGAFHPATDAELVRRERAVSDRNPMGMMKALFNEMRYEGDYDLTRIAQPVLIVNGVADGFTTVAAGRELAAQLPNARFMELDRASHLAMLERPEEVNRIVSEFLEQGKG